MTKALLSCLVIKDAKSRRLLYIYKAKMTSIQSKSLQRIEDLPLSKIIRPIVPVLDEAKIARMIETLKEKDGSDSQLPPIDVLAVRRDGETYYFGFGGCHRFQAYERLAKEENKDSDDVKVRAKILPITKKQLKLYVGESVNSFFP